MIITYEIGNNLYVNLTNRCSNSCDFCVRNFENAFEHNLWLKNEPSLEEIIKDIYNRNLCVYSELVFCGFGEPLERLSDVLYVAREIKDNTNLKIRINTNGQANLIHNYDITPKFKSLIDSLSISLNASNEDEYDNVCHSVFGKKAFTSLLEFTYKSKKYVPDVQLSVVDCLSANCIDNCKKIADDLGVKLKIRKEVK